jgi:hypothetical protein
MPIPDEVPGDLQAAVYDLSTGRQLERKKLLKPNPTKHGSNPLAFYDT